MQYRIKVPPWCFPALNHVLRLLQNNSRTQMEVWQRDAGARAAYPFPSEPMEGDGREAACSWPVSSLGQHKSPTYLHLHRARSKGSCSNQCSLCSCSHMSVPEAPFRASRGNPRMGHAAAAVARVPEPPGHSCSRMQPNAVIQIRSRRLLSNCQSVLFSKELYM